MRIMQTIKRNGIATVYIGETSTGKRVEFAESLHPPLSINEKWVLIVSTLDGCPVECEMCDAGGNYRGKLTSEDIFEQIDHMILGRFPERRVNSKKFKIQFSRVGEPSFNSHVLEVLDELPKRFLYSSLIPTVSTIAPVGRDSFFEKLLKTKNNFDDFQLQFSIHSTNEAERERIIPVKKWPLDKIAAYGNKF